MYFKRKERGSEFIGECRGVVEGLRGDHSTMMAGLWLGMLQRFRDVCF
jgi:hypothetical protein